MEQHSFDEETEVGIYENFTPKCKLPIPLSYVEYHVDYWAKLFKDTSWE